MTGDVYFTPLPADPVLPSWEAQPSSVQSAPPILPWWETTPRMFPSTRLALADSALDGVDALFREGMARGPEPPSEQACGDLLRGPEPLAPLTSGCFDMSAQARRDLADPHASWWLKAPAFMQATAGELADVPLGFAGEIALGGIAIAKMAVQTGQWMLVPGAEPPLQGAGEAIRAFLAAPGEMAAAAWASVKDHLEQRPGLGAGQVLAMVQVVRGATTAARGAMSDTAPATAYAAHRTTASSKPPGFVPPPSVESEVLRGDRVLTVYPPDTIDAQTARSIADAARTAGRAPADGPDMHQWTEMASSALRPYWIDVHNATAAAQETEHLRRIGFSAQSIEAMGWPAGRNRAGVQLFPDYPFIDIGHDWALRRYGAIADRDGQPLAYVRINGEPRAFPAVPPHTALLHNVYANRLLGGELQAVEKAIELSSRLGQQRLVAFPRSSSDWRALAAAHAPRPAQLTEIVIDQRAPDALRSWLRENVVQPVPWLPEHELQALSYVPDDALAPGVLQALRSSDPVFDLEALPPHDKLSLPPGTVHVGLEWDLR